MLEHTQLYLPEMLGERSESRMSAIQLGMVNYMLHGKTSRQSMHHKLYMEPLIYQQAIVTGGQWFIQVSLNFSYW